MVSPRRFIYWRIVLKGMAIVYGVSFMAGLVLAHENITPQSNPYVYPLLALATKAVGVALALRVAHTTRLSYLFAIGISLWLVSGMSMLVGALSVTSWLESRTYLKIVDSRNIRTYKSFHATSA
jgi:hypothetical protein